MENLKKCSKCGRELPVSEFWRNAQPKMDCRHTAKSVVIFMPKTVRKLRGGVI